MTTRQTNKQRNIIAVDTYGRVKVVGVREGIDTALEILHDDGRVFAHQIYFTRRDGIPFILFDRRRVYLNELLRTTI